MAIKKKVKAEIKAEVKEEESHPVRDVVNKIFPPKPESAETAIIRDLIAIVKSVAPGSNFSALLRAERYLADKAK